MSTAIAERTLSATTGCTPGGAEAGGAWLTATIRPVGMICRCDADRLAALLDALASASSVVVLDLQVARIESARVANVVGQAAALLDARDGCLLCVGADQATRSCLERAQAPVAFVDPVAGSERLLAG
ncbi:hypothetical protein [Sanguibacter suarezii]|uniref:hypothetical protein n=1 Tax=Sanguibacter suarezii TaxID=60921 RepID=UPI00083144A1|nr:hypothetical protein [Sanguibacter suarezii]